MRTKSSSSLLSTNGAFALSALSLDEIDHLLDGLETAAVSDMPDAEFVRQLLEAARVTLGAKACHLLLPIGEKLLPVGEMELRSIASVGEDLETCALPSESQLEEELRRARTSTTGQLVIQTDATRVWLLASVQPEQRQSGFLAVCREHTENGFDDSDEAAIGNLLRAFADALAMRQVRNRNQDIDQCLLAVERLTKNLSADESLQSAEATLVVGLQELLRGVRISLVRSGSSLFPARDSLVAVSNAVQVDSKSQTVRALTAIGSQVLKTQRPIMTRQEEAQLPSTEVGESHSVNPIGERTNERGVFHNYLAIPILPQYAVVAEFRVSHELLAALPRIQEWVPILCSLFQQRTQLLSMPSWARKRVMGNFAFGISLGKLLRLSLFLVLIVAGVWALLRPYPLVIESQGIYEPREKKTIFAPADGFVKEVFVIDGDLVDQGETLLRMRSPDLELMLEELRGRQITTAEEANGVRVTMGQLDPNSQSFTLEQNRLAARLSELEIRKEALNKQLELLKAREKSLTVRAPMQGKVVGKDLELQLPNRPVRRGEALFALFDSDGEWCLKLHVADQELGYVLNTEDPLGRPVQFSFDSHPTDSSQASVAWVSSMVENTVEEGCFVRVHAIPRNPKDLAEQRIGAGVHAYFSCGEFPAWFVWSRPLVEAIQRRLWISDDE